jgi:D-alanyl-D-alanine carboxypeptidase-like protein
MQSFQGRLSILLSSKTPRSLVLLAAIAFCATAFASEASALSRHNARRARQTTALADCGQCSGQTRAGRRTSAFKESPCHAKGYVDPRIARNLNAAMRDMKRSGINPKLTSAWRSSEKQAALRRCSQSSRCRRANPGLYRALPAGNSLHEAGFAVDIAGVAAGPRGAKRVTARGRRIVSIMGRNGFRWPYGLKDPAHFEANPRKYGYRNAKQAIARSQSLCDAKPPVLAARRAGRSYTTSPAMRRQVFVRQAPVRLSNLKTRSRNSRA